MFNLIELGNNFKNEITDTKQITQDVVKGAMGFTFIEMTGLEGGIEALSNAIPINQKPLLNASITYSLIRVIDRSISKSM